MNHSSSEPKASRSAARLFVTLFLVCVLLLGAGGIAFVWLAIHPKHVVSGAIRVAPTEQGIWDSEPKPFDRDVYGLFMQTQALLLSSDPQTLSKVVDDLTSRGLTFFTHAKMPAPTEGELPTPDGVLRQAIVEGIIKIAPIPNSELLAVTMVSENETEAIVIVNSYLRNYVAQWGVDRTTIDSQNITELERHRNELQKRVLEARANIRSLADQFGTAELDPLREMELEQQKLLLNELTQIKVKRMNLEVDIEMTAEEETSTVDPQSLLVARIEHVNSDPLVRALARRMADLQVDLAAARAKEPNDTAAIQHREKVLDSLDHQINTLRRKRRQEFEAALPDRLREANQHRLAQARMELQRVKAYEDHVKRALAAQEGKQVRVGATNLEIQDRQFRLQLDQESLEKVCRRLYEMEMERDRRPRVQIASLAEIKGLVDHRRRWTLVVLGATVVLSVILLIVRFAVRPRQ